MRHSKMLPHILILVLLILFSCVYYCDVISELPVSVHEWAQSDRLSLAMNFYDSGMDFFHPAVNNISSIKGVVGVEFPLQAYLAAALAHIFGRESISTIFRLLDILIAISGLYFLFRAVYDNTKNLAISLIAPLFIFCSPVYIFYSGNYLPDPAAASIIFIALYYLLRYINQRNLKFFILSSALATLAVLIKSSSVAYLAGIFLYGFWSAVFIEKTGKLPG